MNKNISQTLTVLLIGALEIARREEKLDRGQNRIELADVGDAFAGGTLGEEIGDPGRDPGVAGEENVAEVVAEHWMAGVGRAFLAVVPEHQVLVDETAELALEFGVGERAEDLCDRRAGVQLGRGAGGRVVPGLGRRPAGTGLFWLVFIGLGIVPLGMRATMNYTLEICRADRHARYLSTVNLCAALPFLFSPVVGWLVDAVGYYYVFSSVIVLILLGALLSLTLEEPRHRLRPEEAVPLSVETEE